MEVHGPEEPARRTGAGEERREVAEAGKRLSRLGRSVAARRRIAVLPLRSGGDQKLSFRES